VSAYGQFFIADDMLQVRFTKVFQKFRDELICYFLELDAFRAA